MKLLVVCLVFYSSFLYAEGYFNSEYDSIYNLVMVLVLIYGSYMKFENFKLRRQEKRDFFSKSTEKELVEKIHLQLENKLLKKDKEWDEKFDKIISLLTKQSVSMSKVSADVETLKDFRNSFNKKVS